MDSVTAVVDEIVEFAPAIALDVSQLQRMPGGEAVMRRAISRLAQLLTMAKCLRADSIGEAAYEDFLFSSMPILRVNAATIRVLDAAIDLDDGTVEDIDECSPPEVIRRRKDFIRRMVRDGC